uniref:Uncharacterized protein n=1 Tax=viral metagenome TaxID=1070528 RepID=A0A6M3JLN5_9ZZZZ
MERIIEAIACFLMRREWFFVAVNEALWRGGMHIHTNPRKKQTAVVNFPKEGTDGDQSA